jgi:hypothetical protein
MVDSSSLMYPDLAYRNGYLFRWDISAVPTSKSLFLVILLLFPRYEASVAMYFLKAEPKFPRPEGVEPYQEPNLLIA